MKPARSCEASTKCLIRDWETRTFTPDDFAADANIGIQAIDGLITLDDDSTKRGPQWLKLADAYFPHTQAGYGRPSAPRSKRIYYSPELRHTRTWTALDQSHLLQLRVGQQDMCPPSIHPSGERLKWDGRLYHGMLSPIDATTLITACNLRATASLLALHWPAHGRRQLCLALSRSCLETLGVS